MIRTPHAPIVLSLPLLAALLSCGEEPAGITPSITAATTVEMDFFDRPLPNIPLPNDVATRYDDTSATGLRVNASLIAPTAFEGGTRAHIDELDGWGLFMPITIPFSGPLDVAAIRAAHGEPDYATENDVVYLVDIDPDSTEFGRIHHLDIGSGNYPVVLEEPDNYGELDPRSWTLSLLFEEADEDTNGNGALDPGEDTDADGVLDRPNYFPGQNPARDDYAGRADALMSFYERQTDTLILRPMVPLNERTTYAVLVTRRLLDAEGRAVGSPYPSINHTSQNEALRPLPRVLEMNRAATGGLGLDDVAFAFVFTTQSVQAHFAAVRDGLYGYGAQAHLATEYPAALDAIYEVVDPNRYPNARNSHVLYAEFLEPVISQLVPAFGGDSGNADRQVQLLVDSHKYIDFHVIGAFTSPQLFEREDDNGVPLPLNDQSWPPDLDREPVNARPEQVFFWMSVPRPEVSARGRGEPAPLVVYAHGYTSNRYDALAFAGFLAQHGLAMIAIDNVSHGIGASEEDLEVYVELAEVLGLGPFLESAIQGRAFDQDNDGVPDSGADFFSAYAFHTRDMLRQGVVDYLQLLRIVRSFDGEREWAFDLDRDGDNDLAGDFDADGILDVGGDAPICAFGLSLGSLSMGLLGSIEPTLDCTVLFLSGGGLTDMSVRSEQGGVPEAFALRIMGPLYLGITDAQTGAMRLYTLVPSGNDDERRDIALVDGVAPGDTLVVENLDNGERGCGYVSPEGTVRAAAASDAGDRHRLLLYRGGALVAGSTDCEVRPDAQAFATVDRFGQGFPEPPAEQADPEQPEGYHVLFHGELFVHGQPLEALADGLGYRRADPRLRRLVAISQSILDPADPAVYARHMIRSPLRYPGTGETTATHVLHLAMMGDMSVPTSSAAALARALGLLPYLEVDPRYGVPDNQVLIDNYALEGVHWLGRHQYGGPGYEGDEYADGVHVDVENFSQGTDIWGDDLPRLDPPLRLEGDDGHGGVSAAFFGLPRPEGEHGMPLPLELLGRAQEACRADCPEGEECGCDEVETFDPALFYFHMIAHYLANGGTDIATDLCMSRNDCRCDPEDDGPTCLGWPDPPERRPLSSFNR